jgi:hypothetical protein
MSSVSSLTPAEEIHVQKLHHYYLLHTLCAKEIQNGCNGNAAQVTKLYNNAMAQWLNDESNPCFHPPKNDENARVRFYQKVNGICNMKAESVSEYILFHRAIVSPPDLLPPRAQLVQSLFRVYGWYPDAPVPRRCQVYSR